MATTTSSTLLRVARKASRAAAAAAAASRPAAASRAAAIAYRSARAADVAAAAAASRAAAAFRDAAMAARCKDAAAVAAAAAAHAHVPDEAKIPTDKDLESDEALRSLYQRWCKAFNQERDQRDPAEMDFRFELFRYTVKEVHSQNTFVPSDPEAAAIYLDKKREVNLLFSKGEDVSHLLDGYYLPSQLGPKADGGDALTVTEYDEVADYLGEYDMEEEEEMN